MSTQQLQLVCDNSTLANFKAWAKPISDWFRTIGYTNTADTGQVNWGTIASVPTAGTYVYDIFQSNDAYTQFFAKVEYGSVSGTTPNIRITIGTSTSGGGAITGFLSTLLSVSPTAFTVPSTSTQYECNFTGDSANSRIGVMMWRNAPSAQGQELFAIERSLNASGVYTSTYVTVWTCGLNTTIASVAGSQQSIYFGVGAAPPLLSRGQPGSSATPGGWISVRLAGLAAQITSSAFNGTIPFDTCSPQVGFWDYPCTMIGVGWGTDFAEGVTFTVTLYGSTRTYMPSKNGPFDAPSIAATSLESAIVCMRYD